MAQRSQLVVVAGAVMAAVVWVNMVSAQGTLASSGVYTAAQAERGTGIYDGQCASCHELSRFKGSDFQSAWADKPLTDLHTAVKSMPMDNPGSLSEQEYADILAYFLSINTYPAGETELKGDDASIKAITVDAKKP